MSEIQTKVEEHCSPQDRELIVRELVRFNDTHAAPENYHDLVVLSRRDGALVGGLIGYTHWHWLFIKQLWVSEGHRQLGIGTSLMTAAEREAVARGCLHAHCDTFDFQALPFYQKLGYQTFGSLADYPVGHTRYFLSKRNLKEPESPARFVQPTP
ncbi:GNAT family N-acetyltransferase [Luteolibacter soli]|uniref:GNAT family N-acetyltransferase n=1 Tax=Luteolibacter soli TaxID=3135280 RepID=A0ABU9B0L8_9BACT